MKMIKQSFWLGLLSFWRTEKESDMLLRVVAQPLEVSERRNSFQ
jgi:hypothetical protein